MWSKNNLIIRQAKVDDASLLANLGASTFAETFAEDNSAEDMEVYLASSFSEVQQAAELADRNSTIYIAETNGSAIGYAMLRSGKAPGCVTDDRPVELVRLYVSRKHLGCGVGAGLMRECISEADHQGYRTMWLGVWENNHRAQAFYRRWKFREVGTHIFQLGQDSQTDILMERSVSVSE